MIEDTTIFEVDSEWPVHVDLPPDGRFARVARAAASACGALEDFSVDELADLRLVINEIFYALTTIGTGPISIQLSPRAGEVRIAMSAEQRGSRRWDEPEFQLLHALIDVTVDEGQFDVTHQRVSFTGSLCARPV